jgi:hypothetical protein
VIYSQAFGEADKDHHVPNTLQTKFNVGSIGKTFTGIATMQLAERGKLKTSDPVVKYLQDFPFGDKITIHHLLTHTSGTSDFARHPDYFPQMHRFRSNADLLPLIYDQELLFDTPGERFAYSNSGAVLLGAIIEKVIGQSYASYIEENILLPAGMRDTGFHLPNEVVEHRATGYMKSPTGRFQRSTLLLPPPCAAGGIETTAEDLLRYDQALYGETILSEEYKSRMFTPFREDYGYLWGIQHKYGNTVTRHAGGLPGFESNFRRYLDDKYVLIVLSNYHECSYPVANTIEAILFGEEYHFPRPTVAEFLYQSIMTNGIDKTTEIGGQLLLDNGYRITESRTLNMAAYALLEEGQLDIAIAIFSLNTKLFPDEANPYDSLGEAYYIKGDIESAIGCYRKALQIDPQFESSRQMLNMLLQQSADEN